MCDIFCFCCSYEIWIVNFMVMVFLFVSWLFGNMLFWFVKKFEFVSLCVNSEVCCKIWFLLSGISDMKFG